MRDLVLVGGGGHCRSCIDLVELHGGYRIAGIVDMAQRLHQRVLGYEIFGTDEDLPALVREYPCFLVAVGQIKSPEARIRLFERLKELGAQLPTVVSPLAHLSKHCRLGEGTVVMHQALVNAGAVVGANCIVNSKTLIEHDVTVEDHCHIAPAAVLNGGVRVGPGSFVGSGAVIREGVMIGPGTVIGCNATVKHAVRGGIFAG